MKEVLVGVPASVMGVEIVAVMSTGMPMRRRGDRDGGVSKVRATAWPPLKMRMIERQLRASAGHALVECSTPGT
jgi:hypothetical protein